MKDPAHDRQHAALLQSRIFRETLRADVDKGIVRLLRAGATLGDTCHALSVSKERVHRLAAAHGIEIARVRLADG